MMNQTETPVVTIMSINESVITSDRLMPITIPSTPEEWHLRIQTTILFGFFGIWGIILNALPILLTFCTEMRKNKVHLMVGSLSTADLLFSISFVFGQTQYILYRDEIGSAGCKWLAFFTFTTSFFEFIFPPFLSVNRYISLYHNERYDKVYTTRNIGYMVTGSWFFCTIVPFIFTMFSQTGFDDDNLHCCIVVKNSHWAWSLAYWLVIIIPLIGGCDGTMIYCTYKIYKKLSAHGGAQSLKTNVIKQNKELLYFLIADMTFPILFHSTYHIAKFVHPWRHNLIEKRIFTCLYLINACVRGLVTMTMLRPYRRAFVNFFCCKKNQVTPMIDDNTPPKRLAVAGNQERLPS